MCDRLGAKLVAGEPVKAPGRGTQHAYIPQKGTAAIRKDHLHEVWMQVPANHMSGAIRTMRFLRLYEGDDVREKNYYTRRFRRENRGDEDVASCTEQGSRGCEECGVGISVRMSICIRRSPGDCSACDLLM